MSSCAIRAGSIIAADDAQLDASGCWTARAASTTICIVSLKRAKVFQMGRSQAVRLPKEFRLIGDSVLVRREGSAVILEPDRWPDDYVQSFAGIPNDFERALQGQVDRRAKNWANA